MKAIDETLGGTRSTGLKCRGWWAYINTIPPPLLELAARACRPAPDRTSNISTTRIPSTHKHQQQLSRKTTCTTFAYPATRTNIYIPIISSTLAQTRTREHGASSSPPPNHNARAKQSPRASAGWPSAPHAPQPLPEPAHAAAHAVHLVRRDAPPRRVRGRALRLGRDRGAGQAGRGRGREWAVSRGRRRGGRGRGG